MKERQFLTIIQRTLYCACVVTVLVIAATVFLLLPKEVTADERGISALTATPHVDIPKNVVWIPPDSTRIPLAPNAELVAYGKELVSHTAIYLGPKGTVMTISNGMNCQNCHLKSGTKPFGNHYGAVAPNYPKFRARSGTIENVEKRVNDCIERSLNGKKLDPASREMKAFVAYIMWVGNEVPKGTTPRGAGLWDLKPLDRAADPDKGLLAYEKNCQVCHKENAEGEKFPDGLEWKYPPLAGANSYNVGAGLYRLSRFAGFVKTNMPHGTTFESPVLTDEEAWDVAAYINSLPRPEKDISKDWPDIATKPFDHPFGPYADEFNEQQHKYGPFAPIKLASKK
jgi:thiosulfate dehydrogenase